MDDIDGWKVTLQECAGTIAGIEIGHPNNTELRKAARPFLDYVDGLSAPAATGDAE